VADITTARPTRRDLKYCKVIRAFHFPPRTISPILLQKISHRWHFPQKFPNPIPCPDSSWESRPTGCSFYSATASLIFCLTVDSASTRDTLSETEPTDNFLLPVILVVIVALIVLVVIVVVVIVCRRKGLFPFTCMSNFWLFCLAFNRQLRRIV